MKNILTTLFLFTVSGTLAYLSKGDGSPMSFWFGVTSSVFFFWAVGKIIGDNFDLSVED